MSKNGFEHYMMKEIYDTPGVIRKITEKCFVDSSAPCCNSKWFDIGIDKDFFKGIKDVCIAACGTAYHAGLIGQSIIEKTMKIPVRVKIASEAVYDEPLMDKDTLFICISQSGETTDTIDALNIAKKAGARTLGIVNVPDSKMTKMVDKVIYTDAGEEVAVPSTKVYVAQVVYMILLGHFMAASCEKDLTYIKDGLNSIADEYEKILKEKESISKIAKKLADKDKIFFIGRGLDCRSAYEGSLKLREVTYVNSFAMGAGEFKHGSLALLDEEAGLVAIATQDETEDDMQKNVEECTLKDVTVVLIKREDLGLTCKNTINVKQFEPELMPVLSVLPMQLLAYYIGRERGCPIDTPRNLTKAVI